MVGEDSRDIADKRLGEHPVWRVLLRIYDELNNICAQNGVVYSVAYGTAIGAVRHHGFIPWDDDFDVLMGRDHYDHFLHIAPKLLPEWLAIVTWRNTPEYPATYAKLQLTDPTILSNVEKQLGHTLPHGIYIDIFPLDAYPSSIIKRGIWLLKYNFLRALFIHRNMHYKNESLLGRIFYCAGACISAIIKYDGSQQGLCALYERLAMSTSYADAAFVCRVFLGRSGSVRRLVFPKEWIMNVKFLQFEDTQVPVFAKIDNILHVQFGDYMTLPPESKRVSNHTAVPNAHWRLGPKFNGIV